MHLAAREGYLEVIRLSLDRGARVDVENEVMNGLLMHLFVCCSHMVHFFVRMEILRFTRPHIMAI
jgi:hypothetical protein